MTASKIIYELLFFFILLLKLQEKTGKSFDYPEILNSPGDLIILLPSLKMYDN